MTWTEEERKRMIKGLENKAKAYRITRQLSKYLETKAKIKNWKTPNLCKDYSERCKFQVSLISCIMSHYPDKKDRKYCPERKSVDWSEDKEDE